MVPVANREERFAPSLGVVEPVAAGACARPVTAADWRVGERSIRVDAAFGVLLAPEIGARERGIQCKPFVAGRLASQAPLRAGDGTAHVGSAKRAARRREE